MDTFFTASTFGTLSGCTASVLITTNVVRHAFGWSPRWFALAVSMIAALVALLVAMTTVDSFVSTLPGVGHVLLALLNGCLIYACAFGLQNSIISSAGNGDAPLDKVDLEAPATARKGHRSWTDAWPTLVK